MLSNADRALQKILIYRHSSVDLGDELVGLSGYDCAGVSDLNVFAEARRSAQR